MRFLKVQLLLLLLLGLTQITLADTFYAGPVTDLVKDQGTASPNRRFHTRIDNTDKCVSTIANLRRQELRIGSESTATVGLSAIGTYYANKAFLNEKVLSATTNIQELMAELKVLKATPKESQALAAAAEAIKIKELRLYEQLEALYKIETELYSYVERTGVIKVPKIAKELSELRAETVKLRPFIAALYRYRTNGFSLAGNLDQKFIDGLNAISKKLATISEVITDGAVAKLSAKVLVAKGSKYALETLQFAGKRAIPFAGVALGANDLLDLHDTAFRKLNEAYISKDPAAENLRDERIFNPLVNPYEICRSLFDINRPTISKRLQEILEIKNTEVLNSLAGHYENNRSTLVGEEHLASGINEGNIAGSPAGNSPGNK